MNVAKDSEVFSWKNLAHERNWNLLDCLEKIAGRRNKSMASIAMRWLLDADTCDVILFGVNSYEQFEENLGILNFQLEQDEVQKLREASEMPLLYPRNMYDLFCHKESEFYGGMR